MALTAFLCLQSVGSALQPIAVQGQQTIELPASLVNLLLVLLNLIQITMVRADAAVYVHHYCCGKRRCAGSLCCASQCDKQVVLPAGATSHQWYHTIQQVELANMAHMMAGAVPQYAPAMSGLLLQRTRSLPPWAATACGVGLRSLALVASAIAATYALAIVSVSCPSRIRPLLRKLCIAPVCQLAAPLQPTHPLQLAQAALQVLKQRDQVQPQQHQTVQDDARLLQTIQLWQRNMQQQQQQPMCAVSAAAMRPVQPVTAATTYATAAACAGRCTWGRYRMGAGGHSSMAQLPEAVSNMIWLIIHVMIYPWDTWADIKHEAAVWR
jgi:hypothetical protein